MMMKPIYFTLSSGTALKVIPDTQVYQDGHPVICYTYSLFMDRGERLAESDLRGNVSADYVNHPDYLGFIAFEEPGKLFTYNAYGNEALNIEDAEETIKQISNLRDNPELWPFANNQ